MAMTSDLVSSTIVARGREPEGLRRMMIGVGGRAQRRRSWRSCSGRGSSARIGAQEAIMEDQLRRAGAPGADSGGMTADRARPFRRPSPNPSCRSPNLCGRPRRRRRRWSSRSASRRRPSRRSDSRRTRRRSAAPPTTGESVQYRSVARRDRVADERRRAVDQRRRRCQQSAARSTSAIRRIWARWFRLIYQQLASRYRRRRPSRSSAS